MERERVAATDADERAAGRIARHYVERRWKRARYVHADIVALVRGFVVEMAGSEDGKVERACAVVDRVIDASPGKFPEPGYIFRAPYFWKNLGIVSGYEHDEDAEPSPAASPPDAPAPAPATSSSSTTTKPAAAIATSADEAPMTPEQLARAAREALAVLEDAEKPEPAPHVVRVPSSPAPPRRPTSAGPTSLARDLDKLARSAVQWVEPPACHDASCGDCEACSKRSPLSRELFGDLRERARKSAAARETFDREADEARDRELVARRAEQLRIAQEWIEREQLEERERQEERARVRLPLASAEARAAPPVERERAA